MNGWIVVCNPANYKLEEAFKELKQLDWKQDLRNVKVGDLVYIYITKPVMAICYECKVNKVKLQSREIDDSKYIISGTPFETSKDHMELEKLRKFNDELTFEIMKQHGIKGAIRRSQSLNIQPCKCQ